MLCCMSADEHCIVLVCSLVSHTLSKASEIVWLVRLFNVCCLGSITFELSLFSPHALSACIVSRVEWDKLGVEVGGCGLTL